MQLNQRQAEPDQKSRIIRTIRWSQRFHLTLNGQPYGDDVAGAEGIHLELIVPAGTSREVCEMALRAGYGQRDVVSHNVLECPSEWFQEAYEEGLAA